jgi:hypothetical protein
MLIHPHTQLSTETEGKYKIIETKDLGIKSVEEYKAFC